MMKGYIEKEYKVFFDVVRLLLKRWMECKVKILEYFHRRIEIQTHIQTDKHSHIFAFQGKRVNNVKLDGPLICFRILF